MLFFSVSFFLSLLPFVPIPTTQINWILKHRIYDRKQSRFQWYQIQLYKSTQQNMNMIIVGLFMVQLFARNITITGDRNADNLWPLPLWQIHKNQSKKHHVMWNEWVKQQRYSSRESNWNINETNENEWLNEDECKM